MISTSIEDVNGKETEVKLKVAQFHYLAIYSARKIYCKEKAKMNGIFTLGKFNL